MPKQPVLASPGTKEGRKALDEGGMVIAQLLPTIHAFWEHGARRVRHVRCQGVGEDGCEWTPADWLLRLVAPLLDHPTEPMRRWLTDRQLVPVHPALRLRRIGSDLIHAAIVVDERLGTQNGQKELDGDVLVVAQL
ncbi:hypothetical protein HMN09_01139700 [Mycena chlorophos]|uniref:Uncharacterized protein n=1 Tax=Mycena chlorophos TaxID=658473 RepID=A0A8H6VZR0_MYCCL|nr:hypothetical protein HMN09_01139700 [Mycena chlorophos]